MLYFTFFFCTDPATTEIYTYLHTLALHDALPIPLPLVPIVRDRVREIDQDMPRPLREVVAMHPAALGDREFGKHARFELRSIIAGLGDFFGITLAIPLVRILDRSGGELQLLPRRNHQYVEHVADPGARQMGMAEPHEIGRAHV